MDDDGRSGYQPGRLSRRTQVALPPQGRNRLPPEERDRRSAERAAAKSRNQRTEEGRRRRREREEASKHRCPMCLSRLIWRQHKLCVSCANRLRWVGLPKREIDRQLREPYRNRVDEKHEAAVRRLEQLRLELPL